MRIGGTSKSIYSVSMVNRDLKFWRKLWAGSAGHGWLLESLEWIISLKDIVGSENVRGPRLKTLREPAFKGQADEEEPPRRQGGSRKSSNSVKCFQEFK